MNTISQLLHKFQKGVSGRLEVRYLHPLLYLLCVDNRFSGLSHEARYELLEKETGIAERELIDLVARGPLQFALLTEAEKESDYSFLEDQEGGQHWLSWYAKKFVPIRSSLKGSEKGAGSKALHFYGFKGGQARSTVLVLLAKTLADEGRRVLVVDADVEAPSLDSIFEVAAETTSSTLMGLCGWDDKIAPIERVYVGRPQPGIVDLIACRPKSEDYDMDFAGFLLGTTLDARILEKAAERLRTFCDARPIYDYVLFDHRTGLAPSVLPLMQGWPGSAVIFVRPDGMTRHFEDSPTLRALLAHDPETPGAFVTFSLDPKQTSAEFLSKNGKFVEGLLETLSDALTEGEEGDIDPSELQRYWMLWNHDASVLSQLAPAPDQLSMINREALSQLRDVLGIEVKRDTTPKALTNSGATDEGLFIRTPDIERLFSVDSRILYVFGRKGTGKTRLLKELNAQKYGEPLLVAQDFQDAGIQSGGAIFSKLLRQCADNYEVFWWTLLLGALKANPASHESLNQQVSELSKLPIEQLSAQADAFNVQAIIKSELPNKRRVFLIDGVETAVPAAKLRQFVESLFRFLASVQYNKIISSAITIRLFLRSDLHKSAAQNIEQQIEGSALNLRWGRRSILNFAVARIHSLKWFRETFSDVCAEIDKKLPQLSLGALSEAEAEELLLRIFPSGLERNKVKSTTFFATYFSDAGGDSDAKASFYPRLFDGFLKKMNDATDHSDALDGERLNSVFVLRSYDEASTAFISEVRTELNNLLEFSEDDAANRDAVSKLLDAFSGLKTPFVVEDIVKEIVDRIGFPSEQVRDSLNKMKDLGIFEERPSYPGEWRTGRVYKSGLAMKYVRGQKQVQ